MMIEMGELAPFTGYLLSEPTFNNAAISVRTLKVCERHLEQKDCSDTLHGDYEMFKDNTAWFFVGVLAGGAVTALMLVE